MTEDPRVLAHRLAMGDAVCEYPAYTMQAVRDRSVPLDVGANVVPLWKLVQLRAAVERDMSWMVANLRRSGVPWAELAVALGVTTQAAQQRYRDVAPRVRRREGSNA